MKSFLTTILGCICISAYSQNTQTIGSASANIDVTNINATIRNGGDMFVNGNGPQPWNNFPGFEVPRGSGKHSIFSGALWLGGRDNQQNLYLASQTYRQLGQVGFWPGPVGNLQDATHTAKYNKIWKVSKTQIQQHISNYNSAAYVMPTDIATWPGNGNLANGEASQLAPYIDTNADGIYNPTLGDYPAIKGDQALYQILNDKGNVKTPMSKVISAEVHIMNYGFDNPSNAAVFNTLFSEYRIINRGFTNLVDVYAGIWTDFDLGYFDDDFVGCDTLTNRYYVYNGDNDDEGTSGYGLAPPVQSVMFLNQQLSHFLYYNNGNNLTNGNPATNKASDYYNYLRGIWRDNTLLTYGENGTNQANQPTKYMWTGDPVTQSGWSERNKMPSPIPLSNGPADRRGLGSIGPFNLATGQELNFTVAYTYSRGNSNLNGITVAQQDALAVQNYYRNSILSVTKPVELLNKITLIPNPANDLVVIQLPEVFKNKITHISVTDNVGREVIQFNTTPKNSHQLQLNIAALQKGIYQVSVRSGASVTTSKLVKL